jgi:hypothetical protein
LSLAFKREPLGFCIAALVTFDMLDCEKYRDGKTDLQGLMEDVPVLDILLSRNGVTARSVNYP